MILVGCPVATHKMEDEHWGHWLENAEVITAAAANVGQKVRWHAVLHMDGRGLQPFERLIARLNELAFSGIQTFYTGFTAVLQDLTIDATNRLTYICMGRNLVIDAALRNQAVSWIFNVDNDILYPDDVLPKLLECEYPVVGCRVPQAGIFGPQAKPASVDNGAEIDARWHWNTAGALLVHRDVFEKVPWRWREGPDGLWSDDYATAMAMEELGYPTLVRHDVVAQHQPHDPDRPWGLPEYTERGYDLRIYY